MRLTRAPALTLQVLASLLCAGAVPPLPKFASSAVSRHLKARAVHISACMHASHSA